MILNKNMYYKVYIVIMKIVKLYPIEFDKYMPDWVHVKV